MASLGPPISYSRPQRFQKSRELRLPSRVKRAGGPLSSSLPSILFAYGQRAFRRELFAQVQAVPRHSQIAALLFAESCIRQIANSAPAAASAQTASALPAGSLDLARLRQTSERRERSPQALLPKSRSRSRRSRNAKSRAGKASTGNTIQVPVEQKSETVERTSYDSCSFVRS